MKKLLKFLPFLLVAVMAVGFWSCDNDDDDIKISEQQLPTAAKTFLSQYYPSVKVSKVTKDDNQYEVYLANGHEVDFNWAGEWTDVDAPNGQTVPNGFYPAGIDIYVGETLDGAGINEVSKIITGNTVMGYEVELVNGRDLIFNQSGEFVRYDN